MIGELRTCSLIVTWDLVVSLSVEGPYRPVNRYCGGSPGCCLSPVACRLSPVVCLDGFVWEMKITGLAMTEWAHCQHQVVSYYYLSTPRQITVDCKVCSLSCCNSFRRNNFKIAGDNSSGSIHTSVHLFHTPDTVLMMFWWWTILMCVN